MMKKTVTILLSFILVMCLIACGNSAGRSERPSAENNSIENGAGRTVPAIKRRQKAAPHGWRDTA